MNPDCFSVTTWTLLLIFLSGFTGLLGTGVIVILPILLGGMYSSSFFSVSFLSGFSTIKSLLREKEFMIEPKTELVLYGALSSVDASVLSGDSLVVVTVSELGNVMGSGKGAVGGAGARGSAGAAVAGCDAEPRRCLFKSDALISLLRLKMKNSVILGAVSFSILFIDIFFQYVFNKFCIVGVGA